MVRPIPALDRLLFLEREGNVGDRWGASLKVGKAPCEENEKPEYLRQAPLLIYDLWNDPQCLRSVAFRVGRGKLFSLPRMLDYVKPIYSLLTYSFQIY
jgi:hypothetical protein